MGLLEAGGLLWKWRAAPTERVGVVKVGGSFHFHSQGKFPGASTEALSLPQAQNAPTYFHGSLFLMFYAPREEKLELPSNEVIFISVERTRKQLLFLVPCKITSRP